jgi:serine/threonine protein kinase
LKQCQVCKRVYPDSAQQCDDDGPSLHVMNDLAPGTIIRGKYKIVSLIGAGGMATVYRAEHIAFREECAIKIVNDRYSGDRSLSQRFRMEAIVTRRLKHPNAVFLEDLDELDDGRPFMVMEFVKGDSLRDVIRREAPMKPLRAISIARQVAQALAAAHDAGIAHRDIKPENIVLVNTPDGEAVKVLDFGIAKVQSELYGLDTTHATGPGMIIGTPAYMAPEQADPKTGTPVDGRADLYSLGIVLFEMLSGVLPFESDTPMGMLFHQIRTAPRDLPSVVPRLANFPELSGLITRCLQKNQQYRYPTAQRFLADLAIAEVALTEQRATPLDGANFETLEFRAPAAAERRISDPKLEIAHLLVLELVDHAQLATMNLRATALQELELILSSWPEYSQIPKDDLLMLPREGSLTLGFFGNPEAAIRCGLYVGSSLRFHKELRVRIGLHSGPVYRARDLGENLSGGGINFAQRITEWGDSGHILASGTIADLLTQHNVWAACFHELGVAEVMLGVKLRVFNIYTPDAGNSSVPSKLRVGSRKAAALASAAVDVLTPPPTHDSHPGTAAASDLSPAQIEQTVKDLAGFIGPIARIIVKRASQNCATVDELYAAVASEIKSPRDREKFLQKRAWI